LSKAAYSTYSYVTFYIRKDEQLIQRRKTKEERISMEHGGKIDETRVKPVYNGISRKLNIYLFLTGLI
jgi:hypothetical protein